MKVNYQIWHCKEERSQLFEEIERDYGWINQDTLELKGESSVQLKPFHRTENERCGDILSQLTEHFEHKSKSKSTTGDVIVVLGGDYTGAYYRDIFGWWKLKGWDSGELLKRELWVI